MMSETIQLAHGSGGKLSHDLVQQIMLPAFSNPALNLLHDGAQLPAGGGRIAFSTDSFVVKPRFFPGGDIGKLAVCGTVNDVAMNGALPHYLSAGFILEEGFPVDELRQIVASMGQAAIKAGVTIVTGDTKVVEKGAVDGIYINTSGLGFIPEGVTISPCRIKPGQDIFINGYIGDHSIAVMGERHGLTLPATVLSDCAPLAGLVKELLTAVPDIALLRDPTRGGVATTLNEIAGQAKVGIRMDETAIPVRPEVQAVCDILGFDPLYLANEGKVIVIAEPCYREKILAIMRSHQYGTQTRLIGTVVAQPAGQVGLQTAIGGMRLLDMLAGDQLPRIC
jgi:hydrogenase expression/formation protein HypE